MDESTRLLSWLLRDTLERRYAGNKTAMAKDLDIDRHTLWRTFRVVEGENGHISFLVVRQLLYCYMQHNYSLDDSFLEYLEQMSKENMQQCGQVKSWLQSVQSGTHNADSRIMVEIAKQVIPELQVILECSPMREQLNSQPKRCKVKHNCPILKLMEIAQVAQNTS